MRLLIVTQYFWPENFRVNDLVGALVERGHQVTVLMGEPNYPDGRIFRAYAANPEDFEILEGAFCLVLNYLSVLVSASVLAAWLFREITLNDQPYPITLCLAAIMLGRLKAVPVIRPTINRCSETIKTIGVIRSPQRLGVVGAVGSFMQSEPRACV